MPAAWREYSRVATLEDAREALRRHFGYPDFRPGQIEVVQSVVAGRDTLGVLPTGGGKSLCYQVPALVLPGLTVVISPLISLMKDQVDRLERHGIAATFLNATLGPADVRARLQRAVQGTVKLLYVAPERFEAGDLRNCLERCSLALLAVDEAHCISEWGHEFRPSFRRIAGHADRLRFPRRMALTATATPEVRSDIVAQLRLRRPRVIVAGFDRTNLSWGVRRCRDDAARQTALVQALSAHDRPAIVYATTRAMVERVARRVGRTGLRTAPYHAGMTDEHRSAVQERFMAGNIDCLVATNAFGMGIDKPDVRLVVHYAMPGTLESYYQEAGRAGRDGRPADCLLLHAPADRETHEFFIARMFPSRTDVQRTYELMRAAHRDGAVAAQRWDAAVAQFLLSAGVLRRVPAPRSRSSIRLLATPARIRREIPSLSSDRVVLRALWRQSHGGAWAVSESGLSRFGGALGGETVRAVLRRLQDRQFLLIDAGEDTLQLADPALPLQRFGIDWSAVARRVAQERARLDAMERYARTRACRRAFVLRYFGERVGKLRCTGCDNCEMTVRRLDRLPV